MKQGTPCLRWQLEHTTYDLGETIRVDFHQDNQVLFITPLS